jgi:hypothetical protein
MPHVRLITLVKLICIDNHIIYMSKQQNSKEKGKIGMNYIQQLNEEELTRVLLFTIRLEKDEFQLATTDKGSIRITMEYTSPGMMRTLSEYGFDSMFIAADAKRGKIMVEVMKTK